MAATAMEQDPGQGEEAMEESVLLEVEDVEMAYGGSADTPEGRGTLRVTSRRVQWAAAAAAGGSDKTFEVAVPCITLHAISKDPSSFPKPCLYCQVTDEDDEDEEETQEVYFVPQDPESLGAMFEALSKAAMMNPDPPEPGENEGDDELIFDQEGLALAGCTQEQGQMLAHLDSLLTFSPNLGGGGSGGGGGDAGQFDDAEDEEGGEGGATSAVAAAAGNGHHVEGDEEVPQ